MVPAGYTATAPITRIMALIEAQGFDTAAIKRRLNLSSNEYSNPDLVSLERGFDAIVDLVTLAEWRHPGVTLGRIIASELTCMHLKLAARVSNVGEWLALIPATEALIGDLGAMRVEVTEKTTEFAWTISLPEHPAAHLFCEAMIVATARNIDDVMVAHYPPVGAELSGWRKNAHTSTDGRTPALSVLERELRCDVSNSQHAALLRYGPDLLNRATHQVTGQLPLETSFVQSHVDDMALHDTFVIDASQAILSQLAINRGCIDGVASQLAMSTRTLQRRLSDRGFSYTGLVTALRQSRSKHLLLNSELSIDQIAVQLGYDRANAFGAAFRRWWGESPARYRRMHAGSLEASHPTQR